MTREEAMAEEKAIMARILERLIFVLEKDALRDRIVEIIRKKGLEVHYLSEVACNKANIGGYHRANIIGVRENLPIRCEILVLLHELGHYVDLCRQFRKLMSWKAKRKKDSSIIVNQVANKVISSISHFSFEILNEKNFEPIEVFRFYERTENKPISYYREVPNTRYKAYGELRANRFAERFLKYLLKKHRRNNMLTILKSNPREKVEKAHASLNKTLDRIEILKNEITDLNQQRVDALINNDEVKDQGAQDKLLELRFRLEQEEVIYSQLHQRKITLIKEVYSQEYEVKIQEQRKLAAEKVKLDEKIAMLRQEMNELQSKSNKLELDSMRITRSQSMNYNYRLNIEELHQLKNDPFFTVNSQTVAKIITEYEEKKKLVHQFGNCQMFGESLWNGRISIWTDDEGEAVEYEIE